MTVSRPQAVEILRAFNRFHTRFSGVLDASFMGSGFSLTEARVLYEIALREPALAAGVQAELGLDAGYLSRVIRRFEDRGLVTRGRGRDARQRPIELTPAGRAALAAVDADAQRHATESIEHLNEEQRAALSDALKTAARLLSKGSIDL